MSATATTAVVAAATALVVFYRERPKSREIDDGEQKVKGVGEGEGYNMENWLIKGKGHH